MNTKSAPPVSWESAQTFLAVIEQGSFSGAAHVLGLGQPTISRRIAQLERSLAEQLFQRGKHGARPTAAALKLIPAAQQMAKWASEFVRETQASEFDVSGVVRIAAPPGIAVEQLAPFAAQLAIDYPKLRLEVHSAVTHVDLSRGAADVAIRTNEPHEPELVVVHRAQTAPLVVASPEYLAKLEPPCDWSDLEWITWTDHFQQVAPRPMLERVVENFVPIFAADDYLVQKAAAQAGLGGFILGVPSLALENAAALLAAQGLVEVPMTVRLPVSEFYVVCAKSSQQVPRVRAVLDALLQSIAAL